MLNVSKERKRGEEMRGEEVEVDRGERGREEGEDIY